MIRKLRPGQVGAKKLSDQYGERLVCVRYRYDAQTRKCVKTVELIIEESDWSPPVPEFAADELVWLRTGFVATDLQKQIRAAGGKWDSKLCLWTIRYADAVALKLTHQVERRDISL